MTDVLEEGVDLVERLKRIADWLEEDDDEPGDDAPTILQAANEITRLREENEGLRKGLGVSVSESGSALPGAPSGSEPSAPYTRNDVLTAMYVKASDGFSGDAWLITPNDAADVFMSLMPPNPDAAEAVALLRAAKTTLGPFAIRSAKKPTGGHAINAIWQLGRAIEILSGEPASPESRPTGHLEDPNTPTTPGGGFRSSSRAVSGGTASPKSDSHNHSDEGTR